MDLYNIRQQLNNGKSIYELPLRVTFYARVSTEKDEQANSLKNQIEYYSEFIKRNPNWAFVNGYIDEGLSGTSVKKRESFLKMIEDGKRQKFDFIITKEISRFSRSTLDSVKYTQELLNYGVGILFQSDNINTLMPDSELRLTIMSSIAQDEVRKISERVRFGFKRAIESGVVLGNSKIWGYTKQDGKLVVDEKQAEIVRLIFELYANNGLGMRAICAELNERGFLNSNQNPFTFSTIRSIISNPKYKGFYCGKKSCKYDYKSNNRKHFDKDEWVFYKDEETVPPIVSVELWERANKILDKRSKQPLNEESQTTCSKYSYSKKIICTEHNIPYYRTLYRYPSGNKEAWQCKNYLEKGKEGCSSPVIYTAWLDQIINECLNVILLDKAKIINDLVKIYASTTSKQPTYKTEIAKLQTEIAEINKRKDKLLDLSLDGKLSNDEFEVRNNKFNENLKALEAKIVALEEKERTAIQTDQLTETLQLAIENELQFEDSFNSELLDSLVEKIEIVSSENKNLFDVKVFVRFDEVFNFRITKRLRKVFIERV